MKNDKDMLIYGIIVGTLIGASAFYLLKASKKEKEEFCQKAGKILAELSALLESSNKDKDAVFEELMKKIPKKGNLANLAILVAVGIKSLNQWR